MYDTIKDRLSTRLTLPNGYEISIQHSSFHYCGPTSVEVAVIYNNEFIEGYPGESGGVAGHVTSPKLIEILNWTLKQKGEPL